MSYSPINWQNDKIGGTKVNATNLNIMDKGIADAHDMLADHDKKINDFANEQIPEEYVKEAVDNYIAENQAGLASKEVVEEVSEEVGRLSSEIANVIDTENYINMFDMLDWELGAFFEGGNDYNDYPIAIRSKRFKVATDTLLTITNRSMNPQIIIYDSSDESAYNNILYNKRNIVLKPNATYRIALVINTTAEKLTEIPSNVSEIMTLQTTVLSNTDGKISEDSRINFESYNITFEQGAINLPSLDDNDDFIHLVRTSRFTPTEDCTLQIFNNWIFNGYVGVYGTDGYVSGDLVDTYNEIKLRKGVTYRIVFNMSIRTVIAPWVEQVKKYHVFGIKYGDYSTEQIVRFTVNVNTNKASLENNNILNDTVNMEVDNGLLILPKTYSKNGKPTQLIIWCHGAGGSVSTNDSQTENTEVVKYLVANGYAVMDMGGMPSTYASNIGISQLNNMGSPIALQCYIKGYEYCIKHFNLTERVVIGGASMGGLTSSNLVNLGCIPTIAQIGLCPVLDTYNEAFLKPWSSGLPKIALAKLYDFEMVDGEYAYDENKLKGYNPINAKSFIVDNTRYKVSNAPIKFWHCVDDTVVDINVTKEYVNAIKNMGGVADIRTLSSGGHEPQDSGAVLSNPSGNTSYMGSTLQIKPVAEEVLLFVNRYCE